MLVYLYINKNNFNEYMCTNAIVPSSLLKDGKRNRTIGIGLDNFLFVTHKKLDYSSRSAGITVPDLLPTVALTVEVNEESKRNNIVLVSKIKGKVTYKLGTWSAYSEEKHIGAYLIGNIPLSFVKGVIFENLDDLQTAGLVSPDYWSPQSLFSVVDETFKEELKLDSNEKEMLAATKLDIDDIIDSVKIKQKLQAMTLAMFNGTQNWSTLDYAINMDCILQKNLGLKDADIKSIIPEFAKIKSGLKQEKLDLLPFTVKTKKNEINQILYNQICDLLLAQEKGSVRTADDMSSILELFDASLENTDIDSKSKNEIDDVIERIINLIRGQSAELPEELADSITKNMDCLKAIEFVARDPFDYVNLVNSMQAYKLDIVNYRRALIIWSALNGMYSVPTNGTHKDNQILWDYIEAFVDKYVEKDLKSFSMLKAQSQLVEGRIFDIPLVASKLISVENVHESIKKNSNVVVREKGFQEELESAVTTLIKKADFNKQYRVAVASVSFSINKGELLDAGKVDVLKKLLEDFKPKNYKVNVHQLCLDYIVPLEKFKQIYQINPEYWRNLCKSLEGK